MDFGEFIKAIDTYGIVGVIALFMLFVVFLGITFIITHPDYMFRRYNKYMERMHEASFNYRMEQSPNIQMLLDKVRLETKAFRCFIVEMHNGKHNSTGLSFNYGSMTYEALRDDADSVLEDYDDFTIERYPVILQAYKKGYWAGDITALNQIDHRLAYKIKANDAFYFACVVIYGTNGEIGYLGSTFKKDEVKDEDELVETLRKYANQVSHLLDGEKAKIR